MTVEERIKFSEERSREKSEEGKILENQKYELLIIEGDLYAEKSDIQSSETHKKYD